MEKLLLQKLLSKPTWTFLTYSQFTYCECCTKSQIVSEQNCEVSNFQKNNEIVVRISALAFKMGKILLCHIILNEQNIPGAGFCWHTLALR